MNKESRIKDNSYDKRSGREASVNSIFFVLNPGLLRSTRNDKSRGKRGFSLFELLVVIAIVSIVSTISFATFPKMNSRLSLDLLAQDVAMTIREAQVYGTTVMGTNAENFGAYGVSFPDPADNDSKVNGKYRYTIFADLSPVDDNEDLTRRDYYNEGTQVCMNDMKECAKNLLEPAFSCGDPTKLAEGQGEKECLKSFLVGGLRDEVAYFCLNYMNQSTLGWDKNKRVAECITEENGLIKRPDPKATVDIVYRRPKLQASIITKVGGYRCDKVYCAIPDEKLENVGIVVQSEGKENRVIVVWGNGQISVDR